jgi:quercetin dioxygenase-like cupin family protein
MGLVTFDEDLDNAVTEQYSTARGPVLRGVEIELAKLFFEKGGGAVEHSHPEEQIVYVLAGRARLTVGGETYEIGPGQASYHGPNVPHQFEALEDFEGLSFKRVVAPIYSATGTLA